MRLAKKLLKALMWLCAATSTLAICAYAILLGINWRDQPPSEAASRLEEIYRGRALVADEENAYVYLMGFSVAKAEDPGAWGRARIAWAQQLVKQPHDEPATAFPGADYNFRNDRSPAVKALSDACKTVDRSCLSALEASDQSVADWIATEGWVLERYKTLLARPMWAETVPFDLRVPFPAYSNVLEGQKLLLAQAWLAAGRGDAAAVRDLLEDDLRFWRQTLAASDILISKMIAVAALKRHFAWSSIVLRRLPSDSVTEGVPRLWLVPISESERSMLNCLTGEWVFFDTSVRRVKESNANPLGTADEGFAVPGLLWPVLRPMLQVQDTSNRYAEVLLSVDETLRVPYELYPQAVERARTIASEAAEAAFPARAYNILGDALFTVGTWDIASYAVRVSDVEGLRRVAVLTAELRSRGTSIQQVPHALSDAATQDPYTGEPFLWDEEAEAVVFVGLEPGERGRHSILY